MKHNFKGSPEGSSDQEFRASILCDVIEISWWLISRSIENLLKMTSPNFRVGSACLRLSPRLDSKVKWTPIWTTLNKVGIFDQKIIEVANGRFSMTPYQVYQYMTTRGQWRGFYMYFTSILSNPDYPLKLNDQLTANSNIAAPKFFLHRVPQALNYLLSLNFPAVCGSLSLLSIEQVFGRSSYGPSMDF